MKAKWISSNKQESGRLWHLARERSIKGDKSGKVYSTYLVAACSGRKLGGVWGQSEEDGEIPGNVCKRCENLFVKASKERETKLAMLRY